MKEIEIATQLAIAVVHDLPGQRIADMMYCAQGEQQTIVIDPQTGEIYRIPNNLITFVPDPFADESVWLVRGAG